VGFRPRRTGGTDAALTPAPAAVDRSRIMEKLGLHHRSELVRFALNTGLLKAD
jgi:DNA-binding CsgD family transcriptional regulator